MSFNSVLHGTLEKRVKKLLESIIGHDEAEQLIVRFIIGFGVVLYASIGEHGKEVEIYSITLSLGQLFGVGYLLALFISLSSAYYVKLSRPVVRITMMAVDVTFFSLGMGIMPESTTPLFFIYLLIILGLGFRFGNAYLFTGMIMSLTGFSLAFYNSEYWRNNYELASGVLVVIAFVPVYVSFFIRRLNIAKRKMEEAVSKADAANEAKTKFLTNMSHELRTPLNGVITVSDLMLETKLSSMQKEYADTIQSSAQTLLELVNDVLDFSKVESDKVILDNVCFNLYGCIDEVIKIIKPLADRKRISIYNNISNHTPQFVYGDPVRLKQILINLGNNAVKFTERGHISIHIYATDITKDDAVFYFEIIDTGIGISQEAQAKIFDRFVQEDDSTTRRFGGTGLGTSIAKQLVELMGGTIGVTSNQGKGSRFWFELKLPIAAVQDYEAFDADVLIVSCDAGKIASWKKLLDSWNNKYVIKQSLNEALDVLHVLKYTRNTSTILIDEDVLHISPINAAQAIKEVGIKQTVLLLSTMNPLHMNNPHIEMYYDSILKMPLDSRQFYHALKGGTDFEKHEGVVSMTSRYGKMANKNIAPLNILIAEDQTTNQFVFRRIMESQGHNIYMAEDGQHALDVLGVEKFDLAIVDINMPNVSGIEVIKMFRFMSPDSEMPFIVVTADSSSDTIKECKELADEVLIKPIEKQQLLDAISKLITSKTIISGEDDLEIAKYKDLPLIDIDALNNMLGQVPDDQFLSELYTVFGKDAEKLIYNMRESLREIKTLDKAKEDAHALKGIANNISAKQIGALARHYEDKIQNNSSVVLQADQIFNNLNDCLLATKKEIQAQLSQLQNQLVD